MKKLLNKILIRYTVNTAIENEIFIKPFYSKKNINDNKISAVGIFWGNTKDIINSQIIFLN